MEHSLTFPGVEKADLYRFLKQAQQDEVEAEITVRGWVKEKLAGVGDRSNNP